MDRGVNVAKQMKFTNAPDFSGALNVEYRTELASAGNLSARVSYSYQSEVWPTTDLSPVIRQDGYGLVNAGVIWKLDDAWTFSLQGTNLADKEYRTTGYNIPAVGTLIGFYGPPRQYTSASVTISRNRLHDTVLRLICTGKVTMVCACMRAIMPQARDSHPVARWSASRA
uniref:Tyrosinase n=1 Tax=Stenotrophomonas maltophilia TaxID=40324 RepID=O69134_STEMA|nr:tyrosinase [Stenotrophomonas maltophilia]